MNYRYFILILLLLCAAGRALPAEKWNVLVASWDDQSLKRDRNVGLILRKSISAELGRQENFRVVPGLLTNVPVAGYSEAVSLGHDAKADIIVYGSYFIEKDKLLVTAEVYDILENRLKMRRVYTGAVTVDIFDTIDSMASDIVDKIKEVLPEMTAENETRVKKIRKTLYEKEKVNIKRQLYTRFGFLTDIGSKNLNWNLQNGGSSNSINGSWPITSMEVGLAFRYWNIRFDFDISGLPGLPYYDWNLGNAGFTETVPNIVSFFFSYYLPWWGESFAAGFGFLFQNELSATNKDSGFHKQFYTTQMSKGLPYGFILIWNPVHELELALQFSPLFGLSGENYSSGSGSDAMSYDFPPLTIGAIYFFGDLGLSIRFSFASGHYYEWNINDGWKDFNNNINQLEVNSAFQDMFISLGVVYRVDFL